MFPYFYNRENRGIYRLYFDKLEITMLSTKSTGNLILTNHDSNDLTLFNRNQNTNGWKPPPFLPFTIEREHYFSVLEGVTLPSKAQSRHIKRSCWLTETQRTYCADPFVLVRSKGRLIESWGTSTDFMYTRKGTPRKRPSVIFHQTRGYCLSYPLNSGINRVYQISSF